VRRETAPSRGILGLVDMPNRQHPSDRSRTPRLVLPPHSHLMIEKGKQGDEDSSDRAVFHPEPRRTDAVMKKENK
jgi:hypothetical protein